MRISDLSSDVCSSDLADLFQADETFFRKLKEFPRLALVAEGVHPDFSPPPEVAVSRRADDPVARLRARVSRSEERTVLCADSAGRRETLLQMLAEFGLAPDAQPDSLQKFLQSPAGFAITVRSEERRVGKGCEMKCRS